MPLPIGSPKSQTVMRLRTNERRLPSGRGTLGQAHGTIAWRSPHSDRHLPPVPRLRRSAGDERVLRACHLRSPSRPRHTDRAVARSAYARCGREGMPDGNFVSSWWTEQRTEPRPLRRRLGISHLRGSGSPSVNSLDTNPARGKHASTIGPPPDGLRMRVEPFHRFGDCEKLRGPRTVSGCGS
jgi:hypothetical protein